jgi:hypothetical protein
MYGVIDSSKVLLNLRDKSFCSYNSYLGAVSALWSFVTGRQRDSQAECLQRICGSQYNPSLSFATIIILLLRAADTFQYDEVKAHQTQTRYQTGI